MRLLALISGGIDSPVAIHMMLRKGYEVMALHMDNRPFTDDAQIEKVRMLVKRLEEVHEKQIPLYLAPHGSPTQETIAERCTRRYQCVMCRRMMLRVAEAFARKMDVKALLTGESLGQVASQTLKNIYVESQAIEMPIIRPLIGFDKEEIISIAKEIGTYEISIIPSVSCELAPRKPVINARLKDVLREEEKLPVKSLVESVVSRITELEI